MGFWSFVYEMYIISSLVDKNLWQQIPNQILDSRLIQKNEMMFSMCLKPASPCCHCSFILLPLQTFLMPHLPLYNSVQLVI